MEFTIEKNIEMPQRTPKLKYPFDIMEVGDSFQFPKEIKRTVESSARYFFKKTGKKFLVKSVGEDVMRVWRVE